MSAKINNSHEELRLLYQTSVADLEFFKRQQWSVTNYALLLYAVIVGIVQVLQGNVSGPEKTVLCLVATVVALLGCYILRVLNSSIVLRRGRLITIRKSFSKDFRAAWSAMKNEGETEKTAEEEEKKYFIYRSLQAVVIAGAITVWWLVCLKL